MLNKKQLKQLRKEIVLNSLFLSDYQNSLNIDEKDVCNFFEGYLENLYDLAQGENKDVIDVIQKHDNITNLWQYYISLDYDALPIKK